MASRHQPASQLLVASRHAQLRASLVALQQDWKVRMSEQRTASLLGRVLSAAVEQALVTLLDPPEG